MKRILIAVAALGLTAGGAAAEPGGCLKYGAGGAAAGHFVGSGHAVLGAAGGCAAGAYKRHESRKADHAAAAADRAQQNPVGGSGSHE